MLVLNLPFKALMFLALMRLGEVLLFVLWLKLVKKFLKVRCRLALLPFLISCLIWLDLVASLPLIKERILVIILLLHFLSLMLGSVLVLMLPLLVWLTPDLRIKKSLLKCNWTFFFQAEDGILDVAVTGVQTCALPIYCGTRGARGRLAARPTGTAIRSWGASRAGWVIPSSAGPSACGTRTHASRRSRSGRACAASSGQVPSSCCMTAMATIRKATAAGPRPPSRASSPMPAPPGTGSARSRSSSPDVAAGALGVGGPGPRGHRPSPPVLHGGSPARHLRP